MKVIDLPHKSLLQDTSMTPGGGGEGAARRFNFVEDENDPYPTN